MRSSARATTTSPASLPGTTGILARDNHTAGGLDHRWFHVSGSRNALQDRDPTGLLLRTASGKMPRPPARVIAGFTVTDSRAVRASEVVETPPS
ncbi:hypothetical protein PR202_ga31194 [Eleusine coracana subsp. coracana]|uniref:Uncharacterized protein n=1 Tax=Eleusine coracana subsp. coracana TaxID=191504 RepID=A0AAV5DR02_ELECO|nr:hypothetical protein PR202_ga31194 [Eleusine coracana subsp. coracana]